MSGLPDPAGAGRWLPAGRALPRRFFSRDAVLVARDLVGTILVRRSRQGTTTGRIVEVEAYLPVDDSACHGARGWTPSNRALFGPPGCAYVYPIHSRYCLNAVTREAGVASGVLIRAVEPWHGVALMQGRRGCLAVRDLARGPARLCEAFAVDRRLDRWNLTRGRRLWIMDLPALRPRPEEVGRSVRIGVTAAHDLPLRFFWRHSPFVSGPRKWTYAQEPTV